jgi:hypothetical protein
MAVTDSEKVTGKYRNYTQFQQLHTFCCGVKSVLLKRYENTAKYKEVQPNCREDSGWRIKRGWDIDNGIRFREYNVQV